MSRIGERFKTNEGYIAIIVDYKNYSNVFIVFEGNEDMIPKKVRMDALEDGRVLNPFKRSIYIREEYQIDYMKHYIDMKLKKTIRSISSF